MQDNAGKSREARDDENTTKEAFKRFCERAHFWVRILGLERWSLSIGFGEITKDASSNLTPVAQCVCDWRYLTAEITIDKGIAPTLDDETIDTVLVHEMMHALVNELREKQNRAAHEERVCTELTEAILAAYRTYPRRKRRERASP